MTINAGWANPELAIGQPRIQKVAGFTYLYAEQQNVKDTEVGLFRDGLVAKVCAAYEQLYGGATKPPLLVLFINVPEKEGMYHVQVGYVVAKGTSATGEVRVRYLAPAVVASMVVCCDTHSIWKCYGPLMDFMNQNGYTPLEEGWREYFLYDEGPDSLNNITWVQHLAEEVGEFTR
jgi:hypothetical protein